MFNHDQLVWSWSGHKRSFFFFFFLVSEGRFGYSLTSSPTSVPFLQEFAPAGVTLPALIYFYLCFYQHSLSHFANTKLSLYSDCSPFSHIIFTTTTSTILAALARNSANGINNNFCCVHVLVCILNQCKHWKRKKFSDLLCSIYDRRQRENVQRLHHAQQRGQ